MYEESIEECARQSLNNLKDIAKEAGASMDDVVKTNTLTLFCSNIEIHKETL